LRDADVCGVGLGFGTKQDVFIQLRPKTFARLAAIGIARRLATMFMKFAG